jgi:hypothetical protein
MKATKEEFVDKLSELLQMANIEVESARLVNGETIIVRFESGAEKEVNVRFDSHYVMIQDLVKQLDI